MTNGVFKGRSISVVNDFSLDEQRYLYQKTRELKTAVLNKSSAVDTFRINRKDFSAYLIFLENSTRTRESFKNAAEFHQVRVNMFDSATSSFAKNESITDTIKMLVGYAPESCFIIRSKLEGTCTWLDYYIGAWAEEHGHSRPSFINAGDGKHEHPTQEFLDEFTFLEHLNWDMSSIHVALIGDLYHGRTVHSKADGLRIFKQVTVDLIAPQELMMPVYYINKMKENGFTVRLFSSLDEYLAQGGTAQIWYFTRLQLERMGDSVLEKAPLLRKAVTFRKDMIEKLEPGTRFYHPLPRDRLNPEIPPFLDETPLNGWDEQSANGYYTRIIEMALCAGHLGNDFSGTQHTEPEFADDFIVEAPIVKHEKPEYKVGIKPVENGLVIDHIATGLPVAAIWDRIDTIRKLMNLNLRSSHGVYHSNKGLDIYKGIISIPDLQTFGEKNLKRLGAISPGCTLNIIQNHTVVKKFRLGMPPRIYNFSDISCKNENCISNPKHQEHIEPYFIRKRTAEGKDIFICKWCEKEHDFSEIWDM